MDAEADEKGRYMFKFELGGAQRSVLRVPRAAMVIGT